MAWFRALPTWARGATIGAAALATLGCELLAGIDDRSTAASGTSSTTSSGGGSSSATGGSGPMSGPTSGPGGTGTGTGGTAGAGGGNACPAGYDHCDERNPTACLSLNSMAHCQVCGMQCDGACFDGRCNKAVPTDDLVLWLRGDAGIETEGNLVTSWYSEVGGGAAGATVPSARPKLGAMGLRPALVFDGIDDHLELPSLGECSGMTIFIAFAPDVVGPAALMRFGAGNPNYTVSLYHQTGDNLVYEAFTPSEPPFVFETNFFVDGSHTVAAMNDGAGNVSMWLDGQGAAPLVQPGAPPFVMPSFESGMLSSNNLRGPWLQGRVAEIMVYRTALASTADVDLYLALKYVFQ